MAAQQTLSKVKNLEKFIQRYGDDTFISQTISKILDYKIQKYKEPKLSDFFGDYSSRGNGNSLSLILGGHPCPPPRVKFRLTFLVRLEILKPVQGYCRYL